jgi:hypothetical protein
MRGGPLKYSKSRKAWTDVKDPSVLKATLSINGESYDLLENSFSWNNNRGPEIISILHMFSYIDFDGDISTDRWYNTMYPKQEFLESMEDDTFTFTIPDYQWGTADEPEYHTATFKIILSKKMADEIRSLFY